MKHTHTRRPARIKLLLAVVVTLGFLLNGLAREGAVAADTGQSAVEGREVDEIQAASGASTKEISARFQHAVIMLHAGEYDYAVTALRRVL